MGRIGSDTDKRGRKCSFALDAGRNEVGFARFGPDRVWLGKKKLDVLVWIEKIRCGKTRMEMLVGNVSS